MLIGHFVASDPARRSSCVPGGRYVIIFNSVGEKGYLYMKLQESGEMYLETILVLSKTKPQVRSIDICDEMGYSKPSVSRAVGLLKENGYIKVDAGGYITLTDSGMAVATKIYDRHTTLSEFLKDIGVSEETAADDACKIEHVISDEAMDAIKEVIRNKGIKI